MDLIVDYRALSALIPYARNARTHSDAQIAQIAASIREFGWTQPVLVDGENGIIAGHGRVLAARQLGIESVPVIELGHLTPTQRQAHCRPSPLRLSLAVVAGFLMGGKAEGKNRVATVISCRFLYESWIEFDSDPRLQLHFLTRLVKSIKPNKYGVLW